ncbi:MAG: ORF2 [Zhejiang mamastrovirus 4]|nr:MAG: ORF2 [Zhejiang mamastrovirus 4]
MANNQNNVQPKVVTTTTTTTSRRGGRRRRRNPRSSAPNTTTVRKVTTTRQPSGAPRRRRNRFGKSRGAPLGGIKQRITATLGTVGSNQGPNIELEMAALLNPALMKESTGSNEYGPLQIYASTYSLWKLDFIKLTLTPLVGQNAVSGTAVRASFNVSGQPGSPNWSSLGARKHKDTNPGRPLTFYLSGSDIKGPKEGWFYCNTKNDPKMCIAGTIEIHTLGKTVSSYKNEPFNAPLFLAELTGQWSFKNYNPQPGMLNLVKTTIEEKPQEIKIHSKNGEPILISVPEGSTMARTVSGADSLAGATASEIVWQICDSAISIASGAFPPPFKWLFECGWWFVKRVANRKQGGQDVPGEPNPGELTFQVYQSISDAKNDVPCIATGDATTVNATINDLEMMQITPGNIGQAQDTGPVSRSMPLTLDPIEITSRPDFGKSAFYGHIYDRAPHSCVVVKSVDGAKQVYTYSIWNLNHPNFFQNGQLVDPTHLQSTPYPIFAKENQTYIKLGLVYAAGYARIGDRNPLYHWTNVLWKADVSKMVKIQGTDQKSDMFVFMQPTQSQQPSADFPRTVYNATTTQKYSFGGGHATEIEILKGNWYLSSFVACQVSPSKEVEFYNYGVPFYNGLGLPNPGTQLYQPPKEAFEIGAVMQSTMPFILKPPAPTTTALTTSELFQLRQLLAGAGASSLPLPPPLPEYDNPEMPPLEGDVEEEQGAVGGEELQRDIKNWVEFGHRKRPPTPFSPIEEEEEDEEESDLDDDDYAEPPSVIRNLLTPEAKDLYGDLRRKGLSHEQATRAAQAAFPHFALEAWEAAYHNAMADGLSPPTARDCAWSAVSDFLP